MKDVFPDLLGFETCTKFMQKRSLLEFAMFKFILNDEFEPTVESIISESGINLHDSDIPHLFQAVAQNKVIFIAFQELYNKTNFMSCIHLSCRLGADSLIVGMMLKKAGLKNIFSFEYLTSEQKESIKSELSEKIKIMRTKTFA